MDDGSAEAVVAPEGNNSICSVSANNFIIALRNMSIKSSALDAWRIPNQQH